MCNALSKTGLKVILITPYIDLKIKKKIKKNFSIKYDFEIKSIFKNKKNLNFVTRLLFAFFCLKIIKNQKNSLVISRSVISSIILSQNNIFNFIEIHHELKGFTNFFYFLNKRIVKKNSKHIFINKYLLNFFNLNKENYIILDDAVNINLFKDHRVKKIKNTSAYFGSLSKGKGIEIITETAKRLKDFNFHVYGDLSLLELSNNTFKKIKNIKFFNHVDYAKIPKLMSKYEIVLMPYLSKVSVRSSNLNTVKYMSPLKLFEYLSMSKIILATKLDVYKHILTHKKNSILIPLNQKNLWDKYIVNIFNNLKKYKYLKVNAKRTSVRYTWDLRVEKIISEFKKLS